VDELIGLLTRERLLLERLLFRATELRLLLGHSDPRFIAWASADLSSASDALRDAELRRAVVFTQLADKMGWPPEAFDWERLVTVSEEPHTTILLELRGALATLAAELRSQLTMIRQLGEAGLEGVTEFLEKLASSPEEVAKASTPADTQASTRWQPPAGSSRIDRNL